MESPQVKELDMSSQINLSETPWKGAKSCAFVGLILGRVVMGLFGKTVPKTVGQFISLFFVYCVLSYTNSMCVDY